MNTAVDKNAVNNSIDASNTAQLQLVSVSITNEELIQVISDLLDLHIVCKRILCLDEKQVVERIWYLTNKWIEVIGSVKYIPGLVEELSKCITKKLWDSDIDYDLINELFLKTYVLRREVELPSESIEEYRELVSEFINKLGYSGSSKLINNIVEEGGTEDLITLFVLSLIISTNIEYSHFN